MFYLSIVLKTGELYRAGALVTGLAQVVTFSKRAVGAVPGRPPWAPARLIM